MPNSVIDGVQDDEGEKAIVQGLFESFEHAGAIGLLHLGFIFILHDLGSPQGDTELAEAKTARGSALVSTRPETTLRSSFSCTERSSLGSTTESLPLFQRATLLLSLMVMSHDVTIPSSSLSFQNLDLSLLFPPQ